MECEAESKWVIRVPRRCVSSTAWKNNGRNGEVFEKDLN